VSKLCEYYGVSRNGYYKRQAEKVNEAMGREIILEMILKERQQQPRIGGKKLYHIYKAAIHEIAPHCGRDKFFGILKSNGLLVARKHSSTRTTNSFHRFHTYKNLVLGLPLERPNQVWVSDITYLRTGSKFAYLSLITDKYSRKIIGWYLSENLGMEGSIKALQKALSTCSNPAGVIHHSDRGIQYCSNPYTQMLQKRKMLISMTEENHCYENGLAERVNGILKDEYLLDSSFNDFKQAKQACEQAIMMYNTRRPHWALKFKTPEEVHSATA
jgi:transposase InsO family protein